MPSTLLAIVEMFFQWVARQFENQGLLPSSPFTKALAYARNRRNGLEVFTRKFRHIPLAMKKTLTYVQSKEMARHEILAKRVKIDVYFADPHSPWQRPTNENTNGLVREYLPKGLDLAPISQGYLNAIARQLNNRPRKCLDLETPAEVFARKIMNFQPGVALQS